MVVAAAVGAVAIVTVSAVITFHVRDPGRWPAPVAAVAGPTLTSAGQGLEVTTAPPPTHNLSAGTYAVVWTTARNELLACTGFVLR